MKLVFAVFFMSLVSVISIAQTANDFTQDDCTGQTHTLYSELDSGKVVVMEFVMDCQLCIDAGWALESMLSQFDQQYPGVMRFYQFAYSPLMDCSTMTAFKDTNNFHSTVFGENSHLMNHYGGFGMPTIGVAAGSNHADIFSQVGFITSDTTQLGSVLRNYFSTISVNEIKDDYFLSLFPNPVSNKLFIQAETPGSLLVEITNAEGKTLLSLSGDQDFISQGIDISFLPAGFYFARIHSLNNVMCRKIVVAK